MLVATLMGIITLNCDNADYSLFQPLLPADADTRESGRCPPLTKSHLR
jgi:protein SERAC1